MKKILLLTFILILALYSFASAQDAEIEPVYGELIGEITGILKGQDSGNLKVEEDYSVVIAWLTGQPASVNLGYALKDVDGNGIRELLVGENIPNGKGTVLYDMYTVRDGKLLHVFDGWERNRYYLCSNGNFMNEGSSGAMQSNFTYFIYAQGDMIFIRSVIYDATMEPEGPWFVSYETSTITADPSASFEEISEEEAGILSGGYEYETLELTPFIK